MESTKKIKQKDPNKGKVIFKILPPIFKRSLSVSLFRKKRSRISFIKLKKFFITCISDEVNYTSIVIKYQIRISNIHNFIQMIMI